MHINALPRSNPVFITCDERTLTHWLDVVLGNKQKGVVTLDGISDSEYSGRVVATAEVLGIRSVTPLSPAEIAHELMRLTREDPLRLPKTKDPSSVVGWQICSCTIGGKPAAILWAAWVIPSPAQRDAARDTQVAGVVQAGE